MQKQIISLISFIKEWFSRKRLTLSHIQFLISIRHGKRINHSFKILFIYLCVINEIYKLVYQEYSISMIQWEFMIHSRLVSAVRYIYFISRYFFKLHKKKILEIFEYFFRSDKKRSWRISYRPSVLRRKYLWAFGWNGAVARNLSIGVVEQVSQRRYRKSSTVSSSNGQK